MERNEAKSKSSAATCSKINYLEGSNDSLLIEDEDTENDYCRQFSYDTNNIDPTVIGAHISENCTKPYVKVRQFPDLPIGDREREGYLTDRMIEVCSCCLEMTVIPGKYALSTCVLERKGLRDIEILGYHQYLKHLNLSANYLESVEVLGKLPFLEYLDVSHNLITKLADFEPPLNISYLNYSHNLIEEMKDFEDFWGLVYLDVSHNLINAIFGLDNLKHLNYLDLSYNKIERLENINNLNIQTLLLDYNNISNFELDNSVGLHTLIRVLHISITNNYLESLEFLSGIRTVESIDASENNIKDLIEVTHLKNMPYLTSLNLNGNPVVENRNFRTACFSRIKRLEELNGKPIITEEKGEMMFMTEKTPDSEFRYNNAIIETINQQKSLEIDSTVIPCYQKFASMILLVGPMSSKRDELLNKILAANQQFAKKGVSYTTRPQMHNELNGEDYYFVSDDEFKQLLLDGKLVCCSHKYGYSYGLSYNEIRKISEEIGILFINCDITSALQIREKFLNCKLVLSLPKSEKTHTKYLQQKFATSPWIYNYLEAYSIGYKSSRMLTQKRNTFSNVASGSNFFNVEQNALEPVRDLALNQSSIVKSQIKLDGVSKRKEQSVSFDHNSRQKASIVSSYDPLSVSEALIPGNPNPYPLSYLSTHTILTQGRNDSVYSTGYSDVTNVEPRSASKSIAVNESMALTAVSNYNTTTVEMKSKSVPDVSFEDVKERRSEKQHIKLSMDTPGAFSRASRNSSDLAVSVSGAIKDKDEYILSVLLSKTKMRSLSADTTSTDFADCFRRTNSSTNSVDKSDSEEMLSEYFIETQLMRRRLYLQIYEKYPGLFYTMVNTDQINKAYEKLVEILKTCVKMQNKYIFVTKTQCNNIYVCKEMRDAKMKMILDAIG